MICRVLIVLSFFLPSMAFAQSIQIIEGWAVETLAGVTTGVGYFAVQNSGNTPRYIIGVESPAAHAVEMHTHYKNEDGVLQMRRVPSLMIPPGAVIRGKPGSLHIMFMLIKKKFNRRHKFPVTFVFKDGERITKVFEVQAKQDG